MPIICAFTQKQQKELRALKRREKNGEDINWEEILTKRMEQGIINWGKYGK